jgi:hypothetical protein
MFYITNLFRSSGLSPMGALLVRLFPLMISLRSPAFLRIALWKWPLLAHFFSDRVRSIWKSAKPIVTARCGGDIPTFKTTVFPSGFAALFPFVLVILD